MRIIACNFPEDKLSAGVQIAALVGMLPKDFQDIRFARNQSGSMDRNFLSEIKDKVVGIAIQKIQMHVPTTMDVDNFNWYGSRDED